MEVLPELEPPFRTTTGATHSTVPGRESDTHAPTGSDGTGVSSTLLSRARSTSSLMRRRPVYPGPAAAACGVTGLAAVPGGDGGSGTYCPVAALN
jgi:hypothetical protein